MGRPKRGFALRLAGLAAAGVALRALYLFTVARHVTGVGDWHFYHWQANLIADGHGFIEPYQYRFDHHVSPSAGHPPLYPLVLRVVSLLGGTSELAHRALGLALGAVHDRARRAARPPRRGRAPRAARGGGCAPSTR